MYKQIISTIIKSLVVLLISSLFFNCSKDDDPQKEIQPPEIVKEGIVVPDTLEPLSFFPVYPGSFWEYNVTEKPLIVKGSPVRFCLSGEIKTSEEILTTAPEYKLDSFIVEANSEEDIYSTPVYVPFYEGEAIYEYDKIEQNTGVPFGFSTFTRFPILSEEIGLKFREGYHNPRQTYLGLNYEVINKELDINGDSILTIKGTYETTTLDRENQEVTLIYKKNVGLIKSYIYHTEIRDTIEKRELVDYFIAFP